MVRFHKSSKVIPKCYTRGWTDGKNSNSTFKTDSIKFEKDIHKWH